MDMNRLLLFFLFLVMNVFTASSQNSNYVFVEGKVKSPSSVTITLKTFASKKKEVSKEANCAALKIIMFDGVDGTIYHKPLLNQGVSALHENESFFNVLFNERLSDYVKQSNMISDFKKAEGKSTLFSVEVNYIQLKKDLERNKISKHLGI